MNLQVFLSDRCNLACDYCFLDLNHGPAVVLDPLRALEAVARHAAAGAQVTFLGGEPLIHFENLRQLAAGARRAAPGVKLGVFTNGLLACPQKLAQLRELGVQVTLSLDGAAANDRHRKLVGRSGSAWDEAMKALESLDPAELRVNMVVCEDTLPALLPGIEDLRRRGLKALSFHLNLRQDWSEEGLEALQRTMAGVLRYCRALPAGALELTHLEAFSPRALDHGDEELILGADGRYYPCDGFFSLPYAEAARWSAGSIEEGVDRPRLEAFRREARDFIHARLGAGPHVSCPRETYFHALASGRDPDRAVRTFLKADAVFSSALRELAEVRAL